MPINFQEGSYGIPRVIVTIYDADGNIVDISGVLTKTIILRNPINVVLTKTATFLTDGTDGKIYYNFESGELVKGRWSIQAQYTTINGLIKTTVATFAVDKSIE